MDRGSIIILTPCLRKGDVVDVKAKMLFDGRVYYHLVHVYVNGMRYTSEPTRGSDYWKTVLSLLEDRLDSKASGSPTQKLWYLKDIGVQITSTIVDVTKYNELR